MVHDVRLLRLPPLRDDRKPRGAEVENALSVSRYASRIADRTTY